MTWLTRPDAHSGTVEQWVEPVTDLTAYRQARAARRVYQLLRAADVMQEAADLAQRGIVLDLPDVSELSQETKR